MPSHHSSKAPSYHSKAPPSHPSKTPSQPPSKAPSHHSSHHSKSHYFSKLPPKAPRRPESSSREDYTAGRTAEIQNQSEAALRERRYQAAQNMEAWRAVLNAHAKNDPFIAECVDEVRRWSLDREVAVAGLIMHGCPVTGYPEKHAWERVAKGEGKESVGGKGGSVKGLAKSLATVALGESAFSEMPGGTRAGSRGGHSKR